MKFILEYLFTPRFNTFDTWFIAFLVTVLNLSGISSFWLKFFIGVVFILVVMPFSCYMQHKYGKEAP